VTDESPRGSLYLAKFGNHMTFSVPGKQNFVIEGHLNQAVLEEKYSREFVK
jgi:hypothetical protein